MTQRTIDLGTQGGADGTGDTIRIAGVKINDNFTELYATSAVQSHIGMVQNEISSTLSNADIDLKPSGTGSILFPGLRFNDNNIETVRTNDDIKLVPSGTGSVFANSFKLRDNTISTFDSNADIEFQPNGTGSVSPTNITIDNTININDNTIKILSDTSTNSDLKLIPNGAGSVVSSKVDVNSGAIDATTIGVTTPAAGSFTTLVFSPTNTGSLSTTGLTITDNTITSTQSNADVELDTNATGKVVVNGIKIPNTDGTVGQVFKTDGNGTLSFLAHSSLYDYSFIDDASATVLGNSSAAQVIDSFAVATYRSAKYHIQTSDTTADRYRLIDINVTHDGTNAYISVFGGVDNGTGDGSTVYDSLEFTADVSGGNVRLLGTVNNTNNQVIKLVRRVIKV